MFKSLDSIASVVGIFMYLTISKFKQVLRSRKGLDYNTAQGNGGHSIGDIAGVHMHVVTHHIVVMMANFVQVLYYLATCIVGTGHENMSKYIGA